MTGTSPAEPPVPPPSEGASPSEAPGPASPRRRSRAGRAREFRTGQTQRRTTRRELVINLTILVVIVVAVYAVVTEWQRTTSAGYVPPTLGPPITVNLGAPVVSNLTCGNGATASEERISWINSTRPLMTGEVDVRVYEIWDRDYYGDPGIVFNVTSSNACAGAPPAPSSRWYVVFSNPNGTNLLTYTGATLWASVGSAPLNFTIVDGSSLTLIANPSLAGQGFGLAVFGFVNDSEVSGSVVL